MKYKVMIFLLCCMMLISMEVTSAESETKINWTNPLGAEIVAVGIGRPDERGMAMSREAAVVAAQRNLVGIIKGVQIDSETLLENLLISNDTVRRNISGMLLGAEIVEEKTLPDGSYLVEMRIPLYGERGSLASAVLPSIMSQEQAPFPEVDEDDSLTKDEYSAVQSEIYSGVIIDADGMDLAPTFSPVIYDEGGREIYGARNIDADFAIREGMVRYADDVNTAISLKRAGNNPIIVKAVSVRGGASPASHVNVVISVADANKILIANGKSNVLRKCNVIFIK